VSYDTLLDVVGPLGLLFIAVMTVVNVTVILVVGFTLVRDILADHRACRRFEAKMAADAEAARLDEMWLR